MLESRETPTLNLAYKDTNNLIMMQSMRQITNLDNFRQNGSKSINVVEIVEAEQSSASCLFVCRLFKQIGSNMICKMEE